MSANTGRQQAASQPAKKGLKTSHIVLIVIGGILLLIIVIIIVLFAAFKAITKASNEAVETFSEQYEPDLDLDIDSDIDMDELNKAIEDMKNLDLTEELEKAQEELQNEENEPEESKPEESGSVEKYSFVDVVRNGDDLTITPNGGLNSSTVLTNGKKLGDFLDYVDTKVLRPGRTINRDMFYKILAIMLVDESYIQNDFDEVERNMIMALAMADNFYNLDVDIHDCHIDASNAVDYKYNVTEYDREDTWIVNYGKRTIFFNNGKTEYHSDMFKDEYLAAWMVAIDEFYGN